MFISPLPYLFFFKTKVSQVLFSDAFYWYGSPPSLRDFCWLNESSQVDSERIGASGANEYFHAFLPRNFGHKDLQNTWHKDGKMFRSFANLKSSKMENHNLKTNSINAGHFKSSLLEVVRCFFANLYGFNRFTQAKH